MVINRNRKHLLCFVLSDHILIQVFFYLGGLQQFQSAEYRSICALAHFITYDGLRLCHTIVADMSCDTGDQHICVGLASSAKRTLYLFLCHGIIFKTKWLTALPLTTSVIFLFSNYFVFKRISSTMPYALASSDVIQ